MSKIHKVKMVTLYNKINDPQQFQTKDSRYSNGIHAQINLLKSFIQKNQNIMQFAPNSFFKAKDSSTSRRKISKNSSNMPIKDQFLRKKSLQQSTSKPQMITSPSLEGRRKLLQINSYSKLKKSNEGNKSERIDRSQEDEYRSFIPIGKIYRQLRHRTQINTEAEMNHQFKTSICLKTENNKFQEKKRLSIFSKVGKSVQRSTLRQSHRANNENTPLQLKIRSAITKDEGPIVPTPW